MKNIYNLGTKNEKLEVAAHLKQPTTGKVGSTNKFFKIFSKLVLWPSENVALYGDGTNIKSEKMFALPIYRQHKHKHTTTSIILLYRAQYNNIIEVVCCCMCMWIISYEQQWFL